MWLPSRSGAGHDFDSADVSEPDGYEFSEGGTQHQPYR